MKTIWRRYEVLLPQQFNDGREIPSEWIALALLAIVDHFGAASHETQIIHGHWRHGGIYYRDEVARIIVDVPDTVRNRTWMKKFKKEWKGRLEQLELWMVSYRIEIE